LASWTLTVDHNGLFYYLLLFFISISGFLFFFVTFSVFGTSMQKLTLANFLGPLH